MIMTALACLIASTSIGADGPEVIPLWPKGAPGFEGRRDEPEQAKDYWVKNIHNPSITAFLPPRGKANGAAVVICPGGGHRELVFNAEGVEAARFLNSLGVTAFALKYRLGREEGSPYKPQVHAREDGLRAMRLVRSRAAEWGIDPKRVGIMGFSAGGEVASMVAYAPAEGDAKADDPVDRLNSRPDFQVLISPGGLGHSRENSPGRTPWRSCSWPTTTGGCARVVASLFQKYRDANAPVEMHVFARGGHAFNMCNRSKLETIRHWPQRLAEWMNDNALLDPSKPATDQR